MAARGIRGAIALGVVLALLALAGVGGIDRVADAAPPAQAGGPVDATQALADADPIADGPPPLGALAAGALLLVGLALSARRA